MSLQVAFKDLWIKFADGDKPWDDKLMFVAKSGEDGSAVDMAKYFREKRKSDNWSALQLLTFAEKGGDCLSDFQTS